MTYKKLMFKFLVEDFLIYKVISLLSTVFIIQCIYLVVVKHTVFVSDFWIYYKYGVLLYSPYSISVYVLHNYKRVCLHKRLAQNWGVPLEFIFVGLEQLYVAGKYYSSKKMPKIYFPNDENGYELNLENFALAVQANIGKRGGMLSVLEYKSTGIINGVVVF